MYRSGDVLLTDHRMELTRSDFIEGTLPRRSWVRASKAYTVNGSVTLGRFGRLSEPAFLRVRTAVCDLLGCPRGVCTER